MTRTEKAKEFVEAAIYFAKHEKEVVALGLLSLVIPAAVGEQTHGPMGAVVAVGVTLAIGTAAGIYALTRPDGPWGNRDSDTTLKM